MPNDAHVFELGDKRDSRPVEVEPVDPLVPFSTRIAASTKRQFDDLAHHLRISKQELFKRMVADYLGKVSER